MITRTYSELSTLSTFKDRYDYLKLEGFVGKETFGFDRYLNQQFYRSKEWKQIRNYIITRDLGCDLAMDGYEIQGRILIHHMNPILPKDIIHKEEFIFDPENLVCVSHLTHNALHYGSDIETIIFPIERTKNDTCPWKGGR